ncbi:uncharacterized protein MAM_07832 [Metarhizium album ARSEF 1941]|uniref:Uncharacterized protein n=1 Tax=Metarhizium album (strain ARSEF 1941) TaxID=1081103 RepID=A0A0B2WK69_METAS|nr:uncharacterized protein MAM_07832 [Metarhizium album ARSEF 1941]KHN94303.1 hypothetical protein MAM_07832 [Metarhizium album ARSEF 1941]
MSNIAAKLAASEKGADAARVRAKLRAARGSARGVSRPTMPRSSPNDAAMPNTRERASPERKVAEGRDAEEQSRVTSAATDKPEKRKRDRKVGKRASRRRSTLSPRELETLISGTTQ